VAGKQAPTSNRSGTRSNHDAESLLAVAVEVFNRRGYDGTSMAEVARAAGITKSTIYHHFSGKEQILRVAVSRALDGLFSVLDERGAKTGPADQRLRHVVVSTALTLTRELPYVTLLLRVRGNTPTEVWAMDRRREFDRLVAGMVDAAAAARGGGPAVDPRLATRLIFGMVNSITEWYRPDRGEDSGQVAEAVAVIALEGLWGKDGGIGAELQARLRDAPSSPSAARQRGIS